MKKLYLIRHANARKDIVGIRDKDRPLSKIGEREAYYIGNYFKKNGIVIDFFYSSPAKRALDTAKIIAKIINFPKNKIKIVNSIYNSNVYKLLRTIKRFSNNVEVAAIFGHNPEFKNFIDYIKGRPIKEFPTCGVFRIDFQVNSWKQISRHKGKITFYIFPKI